MDPIEQAKSERGLIEKGVSWIPGYKGYKEKEMRRAVDKQVRDALAKKLDARARRLTALQQKLLTSGGLQWMDDIEKLVARLQTVRDKIKTASYGYAPFFDVTKVKEDDLDRMIQFDQELGDQMSAVDAAIAGVEVAIKANEGIGDEIEAADETLVALGETFSRREAVIKGAAE
jgi:hypothetical protein